MCGGKYPIHRINVGYTQTINGRLDSGFCLQWPHGFILGCGGIVFTKAGIAGTLQYWDIGSALIARGIGLIDTITFMICLPLMLTIYTLLTVWGIINWILLGLFMICAPPLSPFAIYMKFIGNWPLYYIPTLLAIIGFNILTPMQIILPELTCYVFRIHEW